MAGVARFRFPSSLLSLLAPLLALLGCSGGPPVAPVAVDVPGRAPPIARPEPIHPIMLGIDTLEASGFAAVKGKRIGLLTHPAGVNRRGESTVDVLRRAPGVQLVALFGPEHGIYGDAKASVNVADTIDRRTGLPVYSLYGDNRKPTKAQLKGLDALVIDLQDIGVRSYTFNVVMRYAMDSCFLHGVEVIVLDRPNPLGGLKVDGPPLDHDLMSGVGAFRIPYVHGLTMAELARMAASAPGVLDVPEHVRARGRLTIVPMRGWRRDMRWPETGLTFVPTSQLIQDFGAVIGYAMVGLGCEGRPHNRFSHGLGPGLYPFRGIAFNGKTADQLQKDLAALGLPGLKFSKISVLNPRGQPTTGVYVEVVDWDDWNPTELSFHMHRLACRYDPPNPFAKLNATQERSFKIHVGSNAWWNALRSQGAQVDVEGWTKRWREQARIYQEQTKKYWLYR